MSSYIFADLGLGRARRLGWRRYGVIPLLRSLRRQRLQLAYWQGQFAGAKGTHAPAHARLHAVRRRVGASRASAHKLRAPERRCHKSDTICSGGDVGPRLDAKPTRILAAWRPWRDGSRPGRITWGARARAIGAHAGGSTPPKAIVRGRLQGGAFRIRACHFWCAVAAGGAQSAVRAACRQARALTQRKMRLCLD
jgi:hypothetical protein